MSQQVFIFVLENFHQSNCELLILYLELAEINAKLDHTHPAGCASLP